MDNTELRHFILSLDISIDASFALYSHLQAKWPQLNRTTKIHFVDHFNWYASYSLGTTVNRPAIIHKTGYKAQWWRVIGAAFNKPDWTKRGTTTRLSECAQTIQKEIRLELFGVRFAEYGSPRTVTAAAAYDPVTDTLYVKRRT